MARDNVEREITREGAMRDHGGREGERERERI